MQRRSFRLLNFFVTPQLREPWFWSKWAIQTIILWAAFEGHAGWNLTLCIVGTVETAYAVGQSWIKHALIQERIRSQGNNPEENDVNEEVPEHPADLPHFGGMRR